MEIKEMINETASQEIQRAITNRIESLQIGCSKEIVVLKGDSHEVNDEYLKSQNIMVLSVPNGGGCTVIYPDDVCVGYFTQNITSTVVVDFLRQFAEWLSKHGIAANFTGNDVLSENKYKVASGSQKVFDNEFSYFAIHISMNVDLEQIKNICQKPMVKVPKGLSEYGFDKDEIREVTAEILHKLLLIND